jgi:hypothetical protein
MRRSALRAGPTGSPGQEAQLRPALCPPFVHGDDAQSALLINDVDESWKSAAKTATANGLLS